VEDIGRRGAITAPPSDATILVVDDEPAVRHVFAAALEHAGYRTLEAPSGTAALALLREHAVDLALFDLEMPGLSGIELVTAVRSDARNEALNIVLVSGDGALDSKLAALEAGANDYLVKPVELAELLARVAVQLRDRSLWLARLDRQFAARSQLARRIADLDPSLPLRRLERELLGALSGELPLLELTIDAPSTVDVAVDEELSVTTAEGHAWLRVPLRFAGTLVGVVHATVEGHPERTVSTLTDLSPQLGAVVADGIARQGSMVEARRWVEGLVSTGGLHPVYQPIVALDDGQVLGFEGLTRFADGSRPDIAFARAARAGVGPELEVAAIEVLLSAASTLPSDTWLSLNVSAATLLTGALDGVIGGSDRALVLEVTENEHVDDYAGVRDRLARLVGVRLAVDDAGAGYASLRHIFELRPDMIKLDRSWIVDIDQDPVRQALIHGLVGFSGAFGARIVAEGVERREESDVLRELGVPLAQGYLFGRPAPVGAGGGVPPTRWTGTVDVSD
jgi:EAL domain-containing protein (putative c-di-GMP-specific phosphodiesterase class I)/DNA-binding response OmpR family regulator